MLASLKLLKLSGRPFPFHSQTISFFYFFINFDYERIPVNDFGLERNYDDGVAVVEDSVYAFRWKMKNIYDNEI